MGKLKDAIVGWGTILAVGAMVWYGTYRGSMEIFSKNYQYKSHVFIQKPVGFWGEEVTANVENNREARMSIKYHFEEKKIRLYAKVSRETFEPSLEKVVVEEGEKKTIKNCSENNCSEERKLWQEYAEKIDLNKSLEVLVIPDYY